MDRRINAEPCQSNADCPVSGGNPGICNGSRCLNGTNIGEPCVSSATCGGTPSACNRPGEPLRPNACIDDTINPNPCEDVGGGEGECVAGPTVGRCHTHPNRFCGSNSDCGIPADTCDVTNRPCFPGNGGIGESVDVTGTATPPVSGIADPTTLGVLGCMPPTTSNALNTIGGFPGLVRSVQPGRLVFDNAPVTCPLDPDVCRTPTATRKATIKVRNDIVDTKDQLQWKWTKGAATTVPELGTPTVSDEYDVCLYDASGLRSTFRLPGGGTCDGKPCWRAKTTGFSYRNKAANPHGITSLDLKAGAAGKAKVQVKGSGVLLPLPAPSSLTTPVQLQVRHRPSGLCWGATFSAPFDRATATELRDHSD